MDRAIPAEPFLKELRHHELRITVSERTLSGPIRGAGRAGKKSGRGRQKPRTTRRAVR
jgi:hypothetical protein